MSDTYAIKSVDALESHYGAASQRSLDKEVPAAGLGSDKWGYARGV